MLYAAVCRGKVNESGVVRVAYKLKYLHSTIQEINCIKQTGPLRQAAGDTDVNDRRPCDDD